MWQVVVQATTCITCIDSVIVTSGPDRKLVALDLQGTTLCSTQLKVAPDSFVMQKEADQPQLACIYPKGFAVASASQLVAGDTRNLFAYIDCAGAQGHVVQFFWCASRLCFRACRCCQPLPRCSIRDAVGMEHAQPVS